MPATMRVLSGRQKRSIMGLYGIGTSGAQTRLGGALRARNVAASSVRSAATSAAALQVMHASSAMTTRPVFWTEVRRVPLSIGTSVLGSTTSTAMPSLANSSAAASASVIFKDTATT